MLDAIGQAKTRVFFETFIWKGDDVGQAFKDALIEAADRGVKVYVVFDEFANLVVPRSFYRFPPNIAVAGTR
jgi:cardiolipin synthase